MLFAAAIGIEYVWGRFGDIVFEPPYLLLILKVGFVSSVGLVVAYFSGRGFLRTGQIDLLFIGTAVLLIGLAFLVSSVLNSLGESNLEVTVHNVSKMVAAAWYWSAGLPR